MVGMVVIAHDTLANSLVRAARAIAGKVENVRTVAVKGDDSTDALKTSLEKAVKEVDQKDGVLIFTDMFGGTPTNVALPLLKQGEVEILTGVNLPILLKFLNNRKDTGFVELVGLLREHGKESVVLTSDMLKKSK